MEVGALPLSETPLPAPRQTAAIVADIAEALNAAAQIGDDTLQREQTGTVRPDSFTHGTSEQRQRWFEAGYQTGDLGACNTFEARQL